MTVKLFVEGGGDYKELHDKCRKGFNCFLEKAGLKGFMPRIVACGSRQDAYDDYCTAVKNHERAVLLVDSEGPVPLGITPGLYNFNAWRYLKNKDGWEKPSNAADTHCHLMVETMETWFLADIETLKAFYGKELAAKSFPDRIDIENIPKSEVLSALEKATRHTGKGIYSKGKHSFEILASINPGRVISQSPWAKHFVTSLTAIMQNR